jgi:acyl carrier protein
VIEELRTLIHRASPEPGLADPVLSCGIDDVLDSVLPFSSLVVLGVIVAFEDQYGVRITKTLWAEKVGKEPTLRRLATIVEELK